MNTESSRKIIKKRIIIFAAIVLSGFAAFNLVWFFGIKLASIRYQQKVDKHNDNGRIYYSKEVDGVFYKVRPEPYLGFGNSYLTASYTDGLTIFIDDDGTEHYSSDYTLDFSIWPKFGGKKIYGINFFTAEDGWQFIFTDKDLTLAHPEWYTQEALGYLEEHHEEILDLMEKSCEFWDIEL